MKNRRLKAKDIPDDIVLKFLAKRQGSWTCYWGGRLKETDDVFYAFPLGTPEKVIRAKMRSLIKRKLSGGCPCGCRGDFEITDKGLALIQEPRTAPYSGY